MGIIDSFNPAAQRIFGYMPEEVIGQNINMLMPPPFHEEHDGYLQRYRETGEKRVIGMGREAKGKRKDGVDFPLEILVNEMYIEDLRMFTGTVQDITERVKTEEDLARHRDQLEGLVFERTAKLEDQMWRVNAKAELDEKIRGVEDINTLSGNIITFLADLIKADIGIIYVTDQNQALKLTGSYAYTYRTDNFNEFQMGEGLVGQAALEKKTILFSDLPEDSAKINYGFGELLPDYYLISPFVYEGISKGVIALGAVKKFSPEQKEFIEQAGNDIAIAFNVVQSREKIEALLKETRNQAEKLKNQQEKLRTTNEALEEQTKILLESEGNLKVQQEELQATNEELEEQTMALQESEKKLKIQQEELQATNKELEKKTQYLNDQKMEIEEKNREVENARQEIEAKAKDLEQVSRYKSEFLANMSHELRTPLNSLLILAKMFVDNDDGNLDKDQIESAKVIYSSGSDLLSLINDILDLSKIEAGKMKIIIEDVRLDVLIGNIERSFKPVADGKGIKLSIEVKSCSPQWIKTDSKKVEQILKNLLSNAFKFTEKGSITVSISRPDAAGEITNKGWDPKKTIAISVSDTGIGIPQEKKKLIFEAFQQVDGTTSRKYGGTGLGLSISREFAKCIGGEIGLQSIEGKGSTFTLYLPEAASEHQTTPKNKAVVESIPDRTCATLNTEADLSHFSIPDDRAVISSEDKTLLIIEDDPEFAKILFDMAHTRGFKALIAGDGETGLKLASEYLPKAVILDIMLPGINGWVVMDRLKDNLSTRHIPVHFISALDEDHDVFKKGAIGYISKPVNKEQLDEAFKKIEAFIVKSIKNLMILEPEEEIKKSIVQMLEMKDIKITYVKTGENAYEQLLSHGFDCLITDVKLPDISIFELFGRIENNKMLEHLPVIIYTDEKLSVEENIKLKQYTDSIIIKGVKSMERLVDETVLFLHQVEKNLPEEQQKMIRMLHDRESILKDKKIMIVDDDMRNTFALTKVLKQKGMKIVKAENGEIALKMLDKEPDCDLVLMDIMMPVMDGYEAIREIRKQKRFETLPILALTAKAMKGDREKCIEAGSNDYLSKPVDSEKLASLLRVWLYQ